MSSQVIRNQINNNIRRVITEVRKKVIQEGKKKVMELKDQLLSPEFIIKKLQADINQDSCSIEGRNKHKETAEELKSKLTQIEETAQKGLGTLNGLEDKIGLISSKIELPTPGPIEGISTIIESIKKITDILQYIIMAAPAILATQVSLPGTGGPVSGAVIANTNNGVNLAKVKIAEYTNLFNSLPKLLDKYISMADIVFDKITRIKNIIQNIVNEITKLKLFIVYMELDFEDKCNKLTSPTVPSVPPIQEPPIPPWPEGPLTLADVIAQSEELYGNLLEDLIAQGDHKAIRRVYALGAQFQRIKNTTVEIINI